MQALIAGLKDGTLDVIASDHAPHAPEKKMRELDQAPYGVIGLETLLPICIVTLIEPGHLTWPQLIEKLTINPAKVLGIDRGTLQAGRGRRRDHHRPERGVDDRPGAVPLEEPQHAVRGLEGARPGVCSGGERGGEASGERIRQNRGWSNESRKHQNERVLSVSAHAMLPWAAAWLRFLAAPHTQVPASLQHLSLRYPSGQAKS